MKITLIEIAMFLILTVTTIAYSPWETAFHVITNLIFIVFTALAMRFFFMMYSDLSNSEKTLKEWLKTPF